MTSSPGNQAHASLIVIPTLNEERYIGALIDQLVFEAQALNALVVVADGGSTDLTREIVAAAAANSDRVLLINNPRRIQSAAVNQAVALHGDGAEYVIRIDAHGSYPTDYCTVLLADAAATGADSIVVPMITTGEGLFQRAVAAAQNSLVGTGGSPHRSGDGGRWVDHGHHALMRVDAFRAVQGYDESFKHNEDAELDYRLRQAGFRIWLTKNTRMVYFPRATPSGLFRQYFGYGGGRARNLLKHRVIPKVRQMVPLAVVPAVGVAALSFLHWSAVLPLLAWGLASMTLGTVSAARRTEIYGVPISRAPLVGVAAMIMHLAWSAGFWLQLFRTVRERGLPQ